MPTRSEIIDRLLEGLLHDARNPLNALAINLEVLSDRLQHDSASGKPAARNVAAMKELVARTDSLLERFVGFLSAPGPEDGTVDLSAVVLCAADLLCHEARRRRVQVRHDVDPAVGGVAPDARELRWKVLELLWGSLVEAGAGAELSFDVRVERPQAVLRVTGAGPPRCLMLPLARE